jgi:hypothetical protein
MMLVKSLIILFTVYIGHLEVRSQVPNWEWAVTATKSYTTEGVISNCTDPAGNVFILGKTEGGIRFGDQEVSAGHFIVKMNTNGKLLWVQEIKGHPVGIGTDLSGNLYVAGNFNQTIQFANTTFVPYNSWDIYLVKFDAGGNPLLAKAFGHSGTDLINDFIVSGNSCYFTGHTSNFISFDQVLVQGPTSFVVQLSAACTGKWSVNFPGNYTPPQVKADRQANIYVASHVSRPGCSYFCTVPQLIMLDTLGSILKQHTFLEYDEMTISDFGIDRNRNVYAVQHYMVNTTWRRYLMKYDSAWVRFWKFPYETGWSSDVDLGSGLTIDNQDNVYTAGVFGNYYQKGTTIIGEFTLSTLEDTDIDILVAKWKPSGGVEYLITAGGKGNDGSDWPASLYGDLCTDNVGSLFLAGSFHHKTSRWNSPDQDTCRFSSHYLTNAGEFPQLFVAKLNQSIINAIPPTTLSHGLRFFPNPAENTIYLTPEQTGATLSLFSASGVFLRKYAEVHNAIDVSDLPTGLYIIKQEIPGSVSFGKLLISAKSP